MKVSTARWWRVYGGTAMTSSTLPSSPSVGDEEVLRQASARNALLLTADKDFGELVFRQGLVHSGVVLLRLAGLANATKAEIVTEVCRDRAAELLGAFSVVSPGQIRVRRAP